MPKNPGKSKEEKKPSRTAQVRWGEFSGKEGVKIGEEEYFVEVTHEETSTWMLKLIDCRVFNDRGSGNPYLTGWIELHNFAELATDRNPFVKGLRTILKHEYKRDAEYIIQLIMTTLDLHYYVQVAEDQAEQQQNTPQAPRTVPRTGTDDTCGLTQNQKEVAQSILQRSDLLDIVLEYGRKRLIGEDNTLAMNFISLCSGQTLYPFSEILAGFSGGGKNESLRAIKPLIPADWLFEFTTSTPEAVKYIDEKFHGTLIIYEAAGIRSDTGTLSLRAIGEGESIETIYPTRDEGSGKMKLERHKTNAKNFITTDTGLDVMPDLYRRVFMLSMNSSPELTKRVLRKVIRDSYMPTSLKQILRPEGDFPVGLTDFVNAMKIQHWKREVIVFTPKTLLNIIDIATTREQQVALRTQLNKVLSFIKVLALLNQNTRVRFKVLEKEYVIANDEDCRNGLHILHETLLATIRRIQQRAREALELFDKAGFVSLDKNKVAEELKVSTVTAARILSTLADNGYLIENDTTRPFTYIKKVKQALLNEDKKSSNPLVILQNSDKYKLFYQSELKFLLNTLLSLVTREVCSINLPDHLTMADVLSEKLELDTTQMTSDKIASEADLNLSNPIELGLACKPPMTSEISPKPTAVYESNLDCSSSMRPETCSECGNPVIPGTSSKEVEEPDGRRHLIHIGEWDTWYRRKKETEAKTGSQPNGQEI